MRRSTFVLLLLLTAAPAYAVNLASSKPEIFSIQTRPEPDPELAAMAITTTHLEDEKPKKPKKWKHPYPPHGRANGYHKQDLVPEPATALLFGTGLLMLAWFSRE